MRPGRSSQSDNVDLRVLDGGASVEQSYPGRVLSRDSEIATNFSMFRLPRNSHGLWTLPLITCLEPSQGQMFYGEDFECCLYVNSNN